MKFIKKKLLEFRGKRLKARESYWEEEKPLFEREITLTEDIRKTRDKKKLSTTKLIVAFIFLNCTIVEIYSMIVMYQLRDISSLYALITAVIGETISFAVYSAKATKENTVGGMTYEMAMRDAGVSDDEETTNE